MTTQRDQVRLFAILLFLACAGPAWADENSSSSGPFVFSYFNTGEKGESQGLQFAWSQDGVKWKAIPAPGGTFLKPEVGGKLLRDPSIVQGPDGVFHMVWTTNWWKDGIGIAHSKDLIHWSEQEYLDVMKHEPDRLNCWAPEIFYDPPSERYYIYWSSTIRGRFPETESHGDEARPLMARLNHRVYMTSTTDFKTYAPTVLAYNDGYNVIDAFVVADPARSRYVMVLKDETRYPEAKKNLRLAFSPSPAGPWSQSTAPFTTTWVEGPAVLKLGDEFLVYFDAYTRHQYEGVKTKDFVHWEPITGLVVPEGMRHGTPFRVSQQVLDGLLKAAARK